MRVRNSTWTGLGGVAAAFLGSLCCVGPLLFVAFGVGAGLASTFEPLRPFFGVLMLAMFALAFYTVYGRRAAGANGATSTPGEACGVPRSRAHETVLLWVATILALVFWTFPTWSTLLV
jgi:mercuric ion transport protein